MDVNVVYIYGHYFLENHSYIYYNVYIYEYLENFEDNHEDNCFYGCNCVFHIINTNL